MTGTTVDPDQFYGPDWNKGPAGNGWSKPSEPSKPFAGSGAPQIQQHAADTSMDATKRGFLDTLAGPESRGDYSIKNGGAHFSDFSQFPEGVAPGGTSSAAGRYQITSDTWRELQKTLGLKDFSPASQDKAAWYLAQERYRQRTFGRDLETDLKAGGHQAQIAFALRPTWTSLPGGSQSQETMQQFSAALERNTAAAPAANIAGGAGTAVPADAGQPIRGSASLNIRFHDAPAGMTSAASAEGDLWDGPPRIAHAMPSFA